VNTHIDVDSWSVYSLLCRCRVNLTENILFFYCPDVRERVLYDGVPRDIPSASEAF